MNKKLIEFFLVLIFVLKCSSCNRRRSITEASGSAFNNRGKIKSGKLIFEDNFNSFDRNKWKHENSLAGGGNWEFQWYSSNSSNSFTKNGKLYIRPSLTTDLYSEEFLSSGTIDLNEGSEPCTNSFFYGCKRVGNPINILNPVRSAQLRTRDTFSFKYGRVEIKAKLPTGDWLWPAMWLLPKSNVYGGWPTSGEIDIMEGRGNEHLKLNDQNIGTERFETTLHFGPHPGSNGWETANFKKYSRNNEGFNKDFHIYEMEWTPDYMKFKLDGNEYVTYNADQGFWKRGGFSPDSANPWKNGDKMAPFDQEFYLILNVAVGGVNGYFPDNADNPTKKPWLNSSPKAATDFWDGRSSWLSTWNLNDPNNNDAALVVDYVRVYAL